MYTRSTMPFASALAACAALSFVTFSAVAHAQTFISTDTTLNATNPIMGNVIVGYANQNDFNNGTNPASPTVRLVSGGSVSGGLIAYNNSFVIISGGSVSSQVTATSSTVNLSGGNVGGNLNASSNSIVNVSGGNVGGGLFAYDTGTINLFGTGQIATFVTDSPGSMSYYSLSGLLLDGTSLVGKALAVRDGSAHFTLNNAVPEPGSVALLVGLGISGAGLLARKCRARS